METRLTTEPDITRKIMNICDANNSKWFLSSIKKKHQKITEKISGYFNHFLKNETAEYKEITSICFFYALKNILEKEENDELTLLVDNEFKYFDFSAYDYKNHIKINNAILEIHDSLVKDSQNIEFNNIPVKIKSMIKALDKPAHLFENVLDISNEVCQLPLNENCTEQDYLNLLDKLTTSIFQVGTYNLLKIIDKKNDAEKIITNEDFSFWHYVCDKAILTRNSSALYHISNSFPDNQILQIYILLSAISKNAPHIALHALKKLVDFVVSTNNLYELKVIADQIQGDFDFWEHTSQYAIKQNYFSLIEYINCNVCPTNLSLVLFILQSAMEKSRYNIAAYMLEKNPHQNLLLKCPPDDFYGKISNRAEPILKILVLTNSLDLLKKWITEVITKIPRQRYETSMHTLAEFLIIQSIHFSKKEILLWLLEKDSQNPFALSTTQLGVAMKVCIEKKEKTIEDRQIAILISNDKRFNPNNYISSHSLIEIAATERDFISATLLLQHPKIKLDWIKDTLFAKAIQNDNYQLIGFLLNLSKFSFLEKDWTVWAQKKKLPDDKNISFQAIIGIYRVWYQLKAFSQIEGIVTDITNLIVKNLYWVSCPTPPSFIHGLFGKKPEVIANDTNISQKSTRSFAQIHSK